MSDNNKEKMKELYEKATDIYFGWTKKFDGISEKIFEQTGKKINVGAIVGGLILGACLLLFVTLILKGIKDFLFGV